MDFDYDKWLEMIGPEIACPLLRKRREEMAAFVAHTQQGIAAMDEKIAHLEAALKNGGGNGNGNGKHAAPTNGNGGMARASTPTAARPRPTNGNGHVSRDEIETEICARLEGRLRRANGKPVANEELWHYLAPHLTRKGLMGTGRHKIMIGILHRGPFCRQNGGWVLAR